MKTLSVDCGSNLTFPSILDDRYGDGSAYHVHSSDPANSPLESILRLLRGAIDCRFESVQ